MSFVVASWGVLWDALGIVRPFPFGILQSYACSNHRTPKASHEKEQRARETIQNLILGVLGRSFRVWFGL